jgi:hypothetical protein
MEVSITRVDGRPGRKWKRNSGGGKATDDIERKQ